jgi:hypothetical protein
MKRFAKVLGIMALAGLGVSTYANEVQADKTLRCRMKGSWVQKVGKTDDFEFDAVYIAKNGPDTFSGHYENPGEASADITGAASKGTWVIMLTYTDPKHKGMQKQLVGKGTRDKATNLLKVHGKYKTLVGGNDIHNDGFFDLLGTCR